MSGKRMFRKPIFQNACMSRKHNYVSKTHTCMEKKIKFSESLWLGFFSEIEIAKYLQKSNFQKIVEKRLSENVCDSSAHIPLFDKQF